METVKCPGCNKPVVLDSLNEHLDGCLDSVDGDQPSSAPSAKDAANKAAFSPDSADHLQQSKLTVNGGNTKKRLYSEVEGNQQDPPSASKRLAERHAPVASSSKQRIIDAQPLAERVRPRSLDDFIGQEDVVKALRSLIKQRRIPSMIFWSPPGTGKTTLARVLANEISSSSFGVPHRFLELSATTAGINEIKKIFEESVNRLQLTGQRTILFVDEFQRINRGLQDIFLPPVESGKITLIAATTENPSFRIVGALLSRMRVLVMKKLSNDDIDAILHRADSMTLELEKGSRAVPSSVIRYIADNADGDARSALNSLELASAIVQQDGNLEGRYIIARLKGAVRTALQYDRSGDNHYDTISALHKSIRGSNADAAMYWLARMVEAGDDPLFIARRLIVAASEDCCGNPQALEMATAAYYAVSVVGLPEAAENLAQTVLYLAESPKDTRAYRGWQRAVKTVKEEASYAVPHHIRNAPTKLMKDLGNGKGYLYEPRYLHPVNQEFLPPELRSRRFVSPPPSMGIEGHNERHDDHQGKPSSVEHVLRPQDGQGPAACQRIFEVGSRCIDLDLLEEWERIHNEGRPWEGRQTLEKLISG